MREPTVVVELAAMVELPMRSCSEREMEACSCTRVVRKREQRGCGTSRGGHQWRHAWERDACGASKREGCGDSERKRERDAVAEWVVWVVREVECSHTCVRV